MNQKNPFFFKSVSNILFGLEKCIMHMQGEFLIFHKVGLTIQLSKTQLFCESLRGKKLGSEIQVFKKKAHIFSHNLKGQKNLDLKSNFSIWKPGFL